jgi:hypothetical protein
MDLAAFEASVAGELPPAGLSGPLRALWWDAKGAWDRAHAAAQEREGEAAHDWVHAYLHRKEPDPANAAYWYRRAGREVATGPFAAEWREIATALLG